MRLRRILCFHINSVFKQILSKDGTGAWCESRTCARCGKVLYLEVQGPASWVEKINAKYSKDF